MNCFGDSSGVIKPQNEFSIVHFPVGAVDDQSKWVEKQVKAWVEGVKLLSQAAERYPQAAYAGLSKLLQSEWQ